MALTIPVDAGKVRIRDPLGLVQPIELFLLGDDGRYQRTTISSKQVTGVTALGAAELTGPLYGNRVLFTLNPLCTREEYLLLLNWLELQHSDGRGFLWLDDEFEPLPNAWWGDRPRTTEFNVGGVTCGYVSYKVLLQLPGEQDTVSRFGRWTETGEEAREIEFQALELPNVVP